MAAPKSVGLALGGGLAATLAVFIIYLFNLGPDGGYGLYITVPLALLVGVPMLIGMLVLSVVYLIQRALPAVLLMWGPPLAVLAAAGCVLQFQQWQHARFQTAHPNIREAHINLSGQPLWLDPDTTASSGGDARTGLPAHPPSAHKEVTRYAFNAEHLAAHMRAYEGARLASSFRDMVVFRGEPAGSTPVTVPAALVSTYPDTSALLPKVDFWPKDLGFVHLYFHYPDRVEVAPVLSLGGSATWQLRGQDVGLVYFRPVNLGSKPMVRLEVDGQAIDLREGVAVDSRDGACAHRNYEYTGLNRLQTPLKLRWQFAEVNPPWHAATVALPAFKSDRATIAGQWRSTSIDLYFQADGSVVTERSEEIDSAEGALVVRTTGPSLPLKKPAPCGTTRRRYVDTVRIVSD